MDRHNPSARWRWAVVVALAGLTLGPAAARTDQPASGEPAVLEVDLTEAARRILHARMTIPAQPGPLTLCYPKWVPGTHAPVGPVADLGGLVLRSGGKVLRWKRDDVDAYSFHCQVPGGARSVSVSLDLVLPSAWGTPTPRLAVLNWNQVLLYPRDRPTLHFRPSLRLPAGWKLSTALRPREHEGPVTTFEPVELARLIDSPVLCGAHFREIRLGPAGGPDHFLALACDGEEGLEVSPEFKAGCDRLLAEAYALFGTRHYRSYHFLLALSDHLHYSGLEHHESSDNHAPERTLLEPFGRAVIGYILAHEYVHSWNGKFRRPADMVTVDFQQPERTRLLWVYEGLTDYLGVVLACRSGLVSPEATRDYLALVGERMNNQRGRDWRPLDDTAAAAPLVDRGAGQWLSWRRSTSDYYDEGILLWLEADLRIRTQTKGQRSLDDFCRRFFGGSGGAPGVKPYTFDDVAAGLEAVAPGDWKAFLRRHVTATSERAPLEGFRLGGWRLAYADTPSATQKGWAAARKQIDLSSSLGIQLGPDGTVADVIRGKPADRAGMSPGMKLLAVNGRRWSEPRLNDALMAARKSGRVELLVENEDFFRTLSLEYRDGPRFPRLERISEARPDLLSRVLGPRAKEAGNGATR